ncbi:MAG: hypothetical protein EOM24_13890 [Chloroflexia bacterium]|nr:hypothetical protein [Chloroflexia bacterium]
MKSTLQPPTARPRGQRDRVAQCGGGERRRAAGRRGAGAVAGLAIPGLADAVAAWQVAHA